MSPTLFMVAPGEIEAFLMSHPDKVPKVILFVTPGPHGDGVQRGKLREQALADLA